jgi:aldehyde:ferredoxin oxidoreductase
LDEMLPQYYQLRGWTNEGQLTDDVRGRLKLPS